MTDRELMQQAADKLSIMVGYPGLRLYHEDIRAVMNALRERLAQPEQEPVVDCPRCGHCCPQLEAEREKVAAWMMQRGYATGHGDTVEDLLKELEWQVIEREREACCDLLEGMHVAGTGSHNYYLHAATELRRLRNARSTT